MLQIIRLDNHCVERVNLELGNNIIGSSVVPTGNDDDSVVKHAFTINLARNDEMTITPALPCYIKTRESSRWQLLESGVTLPIKPGDICALLQHKCWFKIVSMADNMEPVCQSGTKRKVDEDLADSNVEIAEKKLCVESQAEADRSSIEPVAESSTNNGTDQSELQEDQVESCPKKEEEIVPVVTLVESGQELPNESGNESNSAILLDKETTQTCENSELRSNEEAQGDSQPLETTVSASNQQSNEESATSAQPDIAGSGEPSTISWREKCKYREKCYRKNPNHKSKYSHPGDVDYDMPDNRDQCVYGSRCYRKSEQHKAEFKHPPKNKTGRLRSRSRRTYQNLSQGDDFSEDSAEESVDESDYDPSSDSQDNSEDDQYSSGIEWEDETVV